MIQIHMDNVPAVTEHMRVYPAKLDRAVVRAINRAIGAARTVEVREIAADTGLKSRVVRDALKMRTAVLGRPEATLAASLQRLPRMDFNARGKEPSRGKGRGVSWSGLRGGRITGPHSFLATMASGHQGVFVRKGRARLGIRELFGPSIGHVFRKFLPLAEARAREALVTNLSHELQWAGAVGPVEAVDASGAD